MTNRDFEFLPITHISQVQKCIEDSKDFIIKVDGPFTYANYKNMTSGSFPPLLRLRDPIVLSEQEFQKRCLRREIRGLMFDTNSGEIVSRTMHKFFNVNEREESSVEYIDSVVANLIKEDPSTPALEVLEKLDGSLITPILETVTTIDENTSIKRLRWRSKLGFSKDLSRSIDKFVYGNVPVESFVTYRVTKGQEMCTFSYEIFENLIPHPLQNYIDLSLKYLSQGFTPLFEYFDEDHKVVISYGSAFLCLLSVRHTVNGRFIPYSTMKAESSEYNVACVKNWPSAQKYLEGRSSIRDLVRAIEVLEDGQEGFVLRLRNDLMFKIKSVWYTDLHHGRDIIDQTSRESYIWKLTVENKIDDLIPILFEGKYRSSLMLFNDRLLKAIDDTALDIQADMTRARQDYTVDGKLDMKNIIKCLEAIRPNRGMLYYTVVRNCLGKKTDIDFEKEIKLTIINKAQTDLEGCKALVGGSVSFKTTPSDGELTPSTEQGIDKPLLE
ncbi:T4 RNA ligase [Acrasis kona]|uniref:T4 RNA ligase n=1 Tax=Acrasis kona TaxID=1008807 RepID=A0AAW2Z533_9EUKA